MEYLYSITNIHSIVINSIPITQLKDIKPRIAALYIFIITFPLYIPIDNSKYFPLFIIFNYYRPRLIRF